MIKLQIKGTCQHGNSAEGAPLGAIIDTLDYNKNPGIKNLLGSLSDQQSKTQRSSVSSFMRCPHKQGAQTIEYFE